MSEDLEGLNVEKFEEFFSKENLEVPMLAAHLESGLTEFRNWHWATQPTPSPDDDYMLEATVEYLKGPVPDQYSVCHAGHGINSYALNFRHVSGELAMFMQTLWGGAYGDLEAETAVWDDLVLRANSLLTITASPSGDERLRKYLLVCSFRVGVQLWQRSDTGWEIVPSVTDWDEAYKYLESAK
jgi:hypothetical protein